MPDITIPGRITYDDYRQIPDDGKRYEILDGAIYMTPALSPAHQYTSRRLQRLLEGYFESRHALVFNAPLDVILADDDVVQPDLVIVQRPQVSARGIEGAPLLVVEILSPSRIAYDRQTKASRYRTRGVTHYWIVDPTARTLECFRLDAGAYRLDASGAADDVVTVPAFEGLSVPLGTIWFND